MPKYFMGIIMLTVMCLGALTLSACDTREEKGGNYNTTETSVLITDYTLPENFAITVQVADCALFNSGAAWYYKTAKIGDDWQLIEYDRDLADKTKQKTHYFEYISSDNYKHYSYDYETSAWAEAGAVNFKELIAVSPNNFTFLYKEPTEPYISIIETAVTYDVDPTSNEEMIDAIRYIYSAYIDTAIIVSADYTNICLRRSEMDGSSELISHRAYDYSTSITDWSSTYMLSKNYKSKP